MVGWADRELRGPNDVVTRGNDLLHLTTPQQVRLSMNLKSDDRLNRRGFIRTAGAAAGIALPALTDVDRLRAAMAEANSAASAVQEFYASLTDRQLLTLSFPFGDPRQQRIHANWNITEPRIGDEFYSDEQRELINQILRNITNEDGYERFTRQMDDDIGGVEEFSVAIFGDPDNGRFQWEMTGRHLTLRADGAYHDKAAFGGPIVYGHGEADPSANMYYRHTQQVNEVFKALDPAQMQQALVPRAPRETAVRIQGSAGDFTGIRVAAMSSDQQQLLEETIKYLLSPFRAEDVGEAMEAMKAGGGFDSLRMSFYEQGDIDDDRVWDMWRIEGPSFVWHFRGSPHVHAYINIAAPAKA